MEIGWSGGLTIWPENDAECDLLAAMFPPRAMPPMRKQYNGSPVSMATAARDARNSQGPVKLSLLNPQDLSVLRTAVVEAPSPAQAIPQPTHDQKADARSDP